MPSSEPVSIAESFKAISERLHESMENAVEKGLTPKGVCEAVALELGVPLDQLIDATAKESVIGMLFMALAGPRRAIVVSTTAAFLAGVTWEQGRAAK
jgi:hypothetical protein